MSTLRKVTRYTAFAAIAIILASCNSKERVLYFQDQVVDVPEPARDPRTIRVEPADKISITVSSSDPAMSAIFNLTNPGGGIAMGVNNSNGNGNNGNGINNGGGVGVYTVSDKGDIDFPVLGQLHVEGLTRQEIVDMIKERLIKGNYLKDPVVTMEFANLHYTMIGEGGKGVYPINNDRINIIEAIAIGGDLPISAERDQIYVIRTEDGMRTTYQLDMRTKDVYNSPAFNIKQNDVIYVVPNSKKRGEYNINENAFKNYTTYFGLWSFGVSLASLVVALCK